MIAPVNRLRLLTSAATVFQIRNPFANWTPYVVPYNIKFASTPLHDLTEAEPHSCFPTIATSDCN